MIKVNLIEFIDGTSGPTKNGIRQSLPMEKCPDKNAKVEFTIRSVLVSANADGSETASMFSAAMSCDDVPESVFDFNDMGEEGGNNLRRRKT